MVESLQVLTRAKASALKARKAAIKQIRSLIVSASDSALAARIALEALAARYQDLDDKVGELDVAIGAILEEVAPLLLEEKCVSSQGTVQLMIRVGDNPERLKQRVVAVRGGSASCVVRAHDTLQAQQGRWQGSEQRDTHRRCRKAEDGRQGSRLGGPQDV
ncbi:hypothetical protein [Atopobium sp. oral taxon 416]|uniref:hypothetical protein n=1 Tax=Atopobium sp. oral taxon 416 TaxID=712157 RepID=UPI001BAAB486|nr:hypothetical protein [Atopobium sp. oral taxon 416]QUC03996.1 hypothetical protein J4859_03360 [Atopobium sp. oral taxon 416]